MDTARLSSLSSRFDISVASNPTVLNKPDVVVCLALRDVAACRVTAISITLLSLLPLLVLVLEI